MHLSLSPRDAALIGVVVLAWGSNFTAMKLGLEEVPPALFVALRFAILVPLAAILPWPRASWRHILGVGIFINTGQFVLLFSGMAAGMSAGLAALILQAQAPLTILLSVAVFGERISFRQGFGIALAVAGMAVIASGTGGSVTLTGLALVLAGALSWAMGNLILKTLRDAPMLPVFIWASLVPPIPMLALSLATETATPFDLIAGLGIEAWAAILYVAVISTVLGYSLWGAVLARNPAAHVTPFALLIPVVSMGVAGIVLGERLSSLEALGAAIVLGGLLLTVLRPQGGANGQA